MILSARKINNGFLKKIVRYSLRKFMLPSGLTNFYCAQEIRINISSVREYMNPTKPIQNANENKLIKQVPNTFLHPGFVKNWKTEELCSVLCNSKSKGGASLPFSRALPLYYSGIDGYDIDIIITDILANKPNTFDRLTKDRSDIPRATLKPILDWTEEMVNKRFYSSWTSGQIEENLQTIGVPLDDVNVLMKNGFGSAYIEALLNEIIVNRLETASNLLLNDFPSINHDVRENIINWINSLIFRIDIVDFNSKDKINPIRDGYLARLQNPHVVFKGIHAGRTWRSLDPADFTAAPFVNRHDAILETIEAIRKPQLETYKPTFVLISNTMGMGKSTFLCECINKFLTSPQLIEKFIFGNISIESFAEIQKRLNITKDKMLLHRADFINKLNLAFSIRHFIPFECLDLNITAEKILHEALKKHMTTLFVGVEVIIEPNSTPVWVRSIDQLLVTDQPMTTISLMQRFSDLIQLNAPKVANLFELTRSIVPHPLPLIFLIDSFHNINNDTETKGSLYQLGLKWVRLNSTVMKELGFYAKPTYHKVKELSPYLSRIIVSILLMCSGNGRAIETFYHICGSDLRIMIANEQSPNARSSSHSEYDTILQKCTDAITNFAQQYPVLTEETQKFDTPYLRLIKIMGCTMSPSTIVKDSNITIEDFQKLGWFVKTCTQSSSAKATYVGSFMMLMARQREQIPDLKNIGVCTGAFDHYHVCYQDLLMPFNIFRQFKSQGDQFENTIAGSIWARYNIACLHSNTEIGLPIPIEEVLPIEMIPEDCKLGKISLRGVVKLHKQFNTFSTGQSLPSDRVILNLDQAAFADIILPLCVNGEQKFIGIQTRYIKTKETQSKPNQVVKCMKQVLDCPNFSYLFISTYLPSSLLKFTKEEYFVQNMNKIKMAQPTNLASVWWNLLMYDQKKETFKEAR